MRKDLSCTGHVYGVMNNRGSKMLVGHKQQEAGDLLLLPQISGVNMSSL